MCWDYEKKDGKRRGEFREDEGIFKQGVPGVWTPALLISVPFRVFSHSSLQLQCQ